MERGKVCLGLTGSVGEGQVQREGPVEFPKKMMKNQSSVGVCRRKGMRVRNQDQIIRDAIRSISRNTSLSYQGKGGSLLRRKNCGTSDPYKIKISGRRERAALEGREKTVSLWSRMPSGGA